MSTQETLTASQHANTQSMHCLISSKISVPGDQLPIFGSSQRFNPIATWLIAGTIVWYFNWGGEKSRSWGCKPIHSHASTSAPLVPHQTRLLQYRDNLIRPSKSH